MLNKLNGRHICVRDTVCIAPPLISAKKCTKIRKLKLNLDKCTVVPDTRVWRILHKSADSSELIIIWEYSTK